MLHTQMISFLKLSLINLILVGSAFAEDEETPTDPWGSSFDKDRGILTVPDGDVFMLTGRLFLPLWFQLPDHIPGYVRYTFEDDTCESIEMLEETLQRFSKEISSMMPIKPTNLKSISATDQLLVNGSLKISHDIGESGPKVKANRVEALKKMKNYYSSLLKNNSLTHAGTTLSPIKNKRKKRVAPLIVGGIALAVMAAGWMWNRIDIELFRESANVLDDNMRCLKTKLEETNKEFNIMVDNMGKLAMGLSLVCEKEQELVTDYNCLKQRFEVYRTSILEWASLKPNMFLRGLNSAIQGKLSLDILPLKDLISWLTRAPEADETIYIDNPMLAYEGALVTLTEVGVHPPYFKVVVSFPRLLRKPFAKRFTQESCYCKEGDYLVTIPKNRMHWWDIRGCTQVEKVTYCTPSTLKQLKNQCFIPRVKEMNITCPVVSVNSPPEYEVIQTNAGFLYCGSNRTLVLRSPNVQNIEHMDEMRVHGPTLINEKGVTSVQIDTHIFSSQRAAEYLNISVGDISFNAHKIDKILDSVTLTELTHMHKLPEVIQLQQYHHVGLGVSLGLMCLISLALGIGFWIYKDRVKKIKSQLGSLYKMIAMSQQPDNHPDGEENPGSSTLDSSKSLVHI